jgi:hypothetical protein
MISFQLFHGFIDRSNGPLTKAKSATSAGSIDDQLSAAAARNSRRDG